MLYAITNNAITSEIKNSHKIKNNEKLIKLSF